MAKFTLSFDCDNDWFVGENQYLGYSIQDTLVTLTEEIQISVFHDDPTNGIIFDGYGNNIGEWNYTP